MRTMTCPLDSCRESIELEDVDTASNREAAPGVAMAMGVPIDALVSIHAQQSARRNETTLRNHFAKHTPEEWVPELMAARAAAGRTDS